MKTKFVLWIISLFLLLLTVARCGKEKEDVPIVTDRDTTLTRPDTGALNPNGNNIPNLSRSSEILGTWKLIGFGNVSTNTLEEVESRNCERCFTISFWRDGIFTANSSENMVWGSFQVKNTRVNIRNWSELGIGESNKGKSYVAAIHKMTRFEFTSKRLRLYYGDERRFLLFAESENRNESESQLNKILENISCGTPRHRDRTCNIVGKWKQVVVYNKNDSIDCSCHDLVYEFRDDGTFVVSGESEMSESFPPVLGTYRYVYREISDCPMCLPAPNLSIGTMKKNMHLFCFVGVNTMNITRGGLNKSDSIFGMYNRIYIRIN